MNFGVGLSALQASQFAIDSISHNIANASTEGYHRQSVQFGTQQPQLIRGFYIGSGVQINEVRRIRDQVLESVYTNSISDLARVQQQVQIDTAVETYLRPGEGSIQNALTGLFDNLADLSANPGEQSLRNSVINQGVNLANRIKQVSDQFIQLKDSVERELELEVRALNQELQTLVDLQNRIQSGRVEDTPNDLLDQRDQLINSIAQRIDIQRYEQVQDTLGLGIAGSSISIGVVAIQFETYTTSEGTKQIRVVGGDQETRFVSGKIAALTESVNSLASDYSSKINNLARSLIQQFDQVHATGVGPSGPFSLLTGSRQVDDVTIALNDANAAFPIQAGDLYVTVTDPNGQRRTSTITIDPATDSLQIIATKLSSIDNLQGLVDPNTGKLTIVAQPDYHFDFTGSLDSSPDLGSVAGTVQPTISGQYTGEVNQSYFVTARSSGDIGKTPGLLADVTDENGNILKTVALGEGYEPGSEIELGNGVSVSFPPGTVVASDSIEIVQVANADETGILSALGFNSFFSGRDATDIAVNRQVLENTDRIATSKTGELGDTSNLRGLIALRNAGVVGDDQLTFEDFLAETNAEIGFRVQSSTILQTNIEELNFQYQQDRDAVSGIDLNEELLNLAQFQKSYDAAVQVVRTMEAMLDELFTIIR